MDNDDDDVDDDDDEDGDEIDDDDDGYWMDHDLWSLRLVFFLWREKQKYRKLDQNNQIFFLR